MIAARHTVSIVAKTELKCTISRCYGARRMSLRGSLQNRPTEPSSRTNLFYPIGHQFGKPNLIQSGLLAGPDSSLPVVSINLSAALNSIERGGMCTGIGGPLGKG